MQRYQYTGNLFNLIVDAELGDEGILSGQFGDLHFRRCYDGIAIINSDLPGSGLLTGSACKYVSVPSRINEEPITEYRNSYKVKSPYDNYSIVIEGPSLNRAYLEISRVTVKDIDWNKRDPLDALVDIFFSHYETSQMKKDQISVSISFQMRDECIEHCEITCSERVIIRGTPNARRLVVNAHAIVLTGKAYEGLETARFSGKIYSEEYSYFGDVIDSTDHFSGIKGLKHVEGALCGEKCWQFTGCESLQSVHLANGIKRVPAYSFAQCTSLLDLYIPDTVTELGEYAFSGCTNLRTIHLPEGIREIPRGLFKDCKSLTKCYLSDTIECIGDEAFMGCTSLKKPWIPKSIKHISKTAFDYPGWGNY